MTRAAAKGDKLRKLMKGIDIAMFTTVGEDGFPVSRPLSTQDAGFDGKAVWFFVRRDSAKVREIERQPRVNVAYASQDRNVYLSVAGIASTTDDPALIERFWSDAYKAFFPGGRDDPQLVLIRVDVTTVEYWDGPSSGIGKALAFVASRVTRNDDYMGENRTIRVGSGPSDEKAGERARRADVPATKRAPRTVSEKAPAVGRRTGKSASVSAAARKRANASKAGDTTKTAAKRSASGPVAARRSRGSR
jgi:general stress protein 26